MAPPRTYHVLMVDDDEVDVMNVERFFRKSDLRHTLSVARNGEEALNGLLNAQIQCPHFILLDLNMPRMNGLEFLRQLRQEPRFRHVVVYVMTTSDNEADKQQAFALNAAGYIVKPLSSQQFANCVDKLIQFAEICEYPGA